MSNKNDRAAGSTQPPAADELKAEEARLAEAEKAEAAKAEAEKAEAAKAEAEKAEAAKADPANALHTAMSVVTPSAIDGPTVKMKFSRRVRISLPDRRIVEFQAGVQDVPESLADHWYLKAHGVERV